MKYGKYNIATIKDMPDSLRGRLEIIEDMIDSRKKDRDVSYYQGYNVSKDDDEIRALAGVLIDLQVLHRLRSYRGRNRGGLLRKSLKKRRNTRIYLLGRSVRRRIKISVLRFLRLFGIQVYRKV